MLRSKGVSHPLFFWLVAVECILSISFFIVTAAAMSMPFETIEKGHSSGIDDALNEVYRTQQEFEAFWARHRSNTSPSTDAPEVDFTEQMVLAVFWGTQRSGGYALEITSVDSSTKDDTELVVNFLTQSPDPGDMVTMALTQPHHIISLASSNKNVKFIGSAKPPSTTVPRMILSLDKSKDIDATIAQIESLPAVTNVKRLGALGRIVFVDFDSDKIGKDEAVQALKDIEGVKTVEEDH